VPVPLPTAADVNLEPPERGEVEIIGRGLMGAVGPPTGITDLQKVLIKAIAHSMTGVTVEPDDLDPIGPTELAEGLRRRDALFRTRIVQLMLLTELVLVPLPDEVARRVEAYAAELGVEESLLGLADRYAAGALGLALVDFDRNGYSAGWDPDHVKFLHTTAALDAPWAEVPKDPALAARWADLENCAAGSLGQGVFRFYRARGFTFPGLPGSAPPLLAQHDWVHVLADYGTTVESEIEVFGLIARANDDPHGFTLLAMVIGLFETGYIPNAAGLFQYDRGHLSKAGMACRLADAMRRGARSSIDSDLLAVDWFELADRPVDELRETFGLLPKDPDAVAAGSRGPWEPGGISPFQFNAGRTAAETEGRPYDPYGAAVL
jgi:hypothetical protein